MVPWRVRLQMPGAFGYGVRPGRDAWVTWVAIALAVAVLVRIPLTLPAIGHVGSAMIALLFIYAPSWVGVWRREELADYGFVVAPLGRHVALAALAMLIVFPLFVVGYFAFYEVACKTPLLANLVPRGMCARYDGLAGVHVPYLTWRFAEFCLIQLFVVALPEELFFRGFMQRLLEMQHRPTRKVWGGAIGKAVVLTSVAFALVHLPKDGDPRALATFFPALLFGWLRNKSQSIVPSTLVHAGSNILIRLLDLSVLG